MLIALALFISTIVEGAHTVWTTQPIVEAKDAVFDPAIIGDWHEVNPPGLGSPFATSITKAKDGKSYVVARRGEELRQPIQLTKIGDHYFLQEISDRNKAVYMRRVAIVGGDLLD